MPPKRPRRLPTKNPRGAASKGARDLVPNRSGATKTAQRRYETLLADLRDLLVKGRVRAEAAAGQVLVETYHALGKRVLQANLLSDAKREAIIYARLAAELDLNERVLRYAVSFARLYPKLPGRDRRLRWTHYRELLGVPDPAVRQLYEDLALQHRWTRDKLKEAIVGRFHARLTDEGQATKKQKQTAPPFSRPGDAWGLYKARVEAVASGEILVVMIELGFDTFTRQRVRLAHVDASTLKERGGDEARDFVHSTLADVEFVMLKTAGIDSYGRAKVHLFFDPQSRDENGLYQKGRHLNAELVASGLARMA